MKPVKIVHILPDLLNLYGDGGNVRILARRLEWRGIPFELHEVRHGDELKLADADLVFLGGAPDREQKIASEVLFAARGEVGAYVGDAGVLLAICGGYQMLGHEWVLEGESVPGLGVVDIRTLRVDGPRIIGDIVLDSPLATTPVVGYENHAGRTYLGAGLEPFGRVRNKVGRGNNDTDGADGVLHNNLLGTYLHGPLLAKNPEIADALISRALVRKGEDGSLEPLDDSVELAANEEMRRRF